MRAIKKEDLDFINFYQVPKWLMDMFIKKQISQGAFKTYVLMYDRTRMSALNNWIDKDGDVYIKYSYDEMCEHLDCSRQSVSNNLKDLEALNLIDKKKNFSSSTTFYLNVCSSLENLTNKESLTASSLENLTTSSLENLDSNNNNFNNNNFNNNNFNNNDCQTDELEKQSAGEFINQLMNQGIRFSSTEMSQIINWCVDLSLDPMSAYRNSSYLRGERDKLKPTKGMFTNKSTWEKMALGDYDDRNSKAAKPKKAELEKPNYEEGLW
jgi:DNA-binding transcriptional regulator GbsR (MarR family)